LPDPQDGELVTFAEVQGMPQLNNHKPIKVKNCKVRMFCWMRTLRCSLQGWWH
jgi:hypothetical protein